MDPRYGIPYYFNAGTGRRQWQRPGAELPPGWQEARDPRSGLPYFFNLATGQRVWERPGSEVAGVLTPIRLISRPSSRHSSGCQLNYRP